MLDPYSKVSIIGSNFHHHSDNHDVVFIPKIEEALADHAFFDKLNYDFIINIYVKEENFIWYMHNFLGKTDEHFLEISNLYDELMNKASGTKAFDQLYQHFIRSYGITDDWSRDSCNDALIEFFYLGFVSDNNIHKNIAMIELNLPNSINLEYEDFDTLNIIKEKLFNVIDISDEILYKKYQQLRKLNHRYFNQKITLADKIQSSSAIVDLNILDQAIIGYLINKLITDDRLDWFNRTVREELYNTYKSELVGMLRGNQ